MRKAKWRLVDSSSLKAIWYDRMGKILHVVFNSDNYYKYYGVSYYRYRKLIHAESKGRYFYYYIRTKYDYRRIE